MSALDTRGAAAARLDCRYLVTEEHPVSGREMRSRQRSHIWPGPRRGYWNSLSRVLMLVDRLFSDAADRMAFASERFWMRWAAHSARISVHGMPHTFSV